MNVEHIEVCKNDDKRNWHACHSSRHVEHKYVHRNRNEHNQSDRHIKACQNHGSDCYFKKFNHIEEITRTYHR